MANKYLSDEVTNTVGYARPIARTQGTLLDKSGYYPTLDRAKEYAASGDAYVGQIIHVVTDTDVKSYVIKNAAGDLKQLGSGVQDGDGKAWLEYDEELQAIKFMFN